MVVVVAAGYAAAGAVGVVAYKYGWATDGTHTIKIGNVATKKSPRITIDAFLTRREASSP